MDLLEQVTSIQFLVNKASSKEEAKQNYSSMEGIFISKDIADKIFANEIIKKFKT